MYQCADLLSVKDPLQGSGRVDVEYYDRHVSVIAQGIGRLVQHPKLL